MSIDTPKIDSKGVTKITISLVNPQIIRRFILK